MNSGSRLSSPFSQRGLTLIELLVALLISSILTLAIFAVLVLGEGRRRTTTAVNDTNQAGNYAAYVLDKLIRSAGSGFVQAADFAYGCAIHASGAAQVLPRTAALPAPFAAVNTGLTFRLAPLLIAEDGTTPGVSGEASDALIVMAGTKGYGELPVPFSDFPGTGTLNLVNSISFRPNDIVLLADQQAPAGGVAPCLVTQVASTFAGTGGTAVTSVPVGGTYHKATVGTVNFAGFTTEARAINLGSMAGSTPPVMMVLGVGDDNTLFSYDLLQAPAAALPIADSVFEMHAVYGVDGDDNGTVDTWEEPAGDFAFAALTAGTPAAAGVLRTIRAVRVGLILRTSLQERDNGTPGEDVTTPGPLTLFADLPGITYTRALTSAEQRFRYRTIETTIPLRNAMM